jgi:hypothetical protein
MEQLREVISAFWERFITLRTSVEFLSNARAFKLAQQPFAFPYSAFLLVCSYSFLPHPPPLLLCLHRRNRRRCFRCLHSRYYTRATCAALRSFVRSSLQLLLVVLLYRS